MTGDSGRGEGKLGPGVGASVQGECSKQMAVVGRRTIKNGMGHEHHFWNEG